MRVSMPKSLVAGVAALALSAVATLAGAPAGAAAFHGGFGGFHGGFGGFHGSGMGAFHPGGFGGFHGPAMGAVRSGMSAFQPGGVGFHHGFFDRGHFRRFDRDDFFRRRFVHRRFFVDRNVFLVGPGGWWSPGYYGYDDGCWVYRPVYRYGVYVGRRLVNICY